MDILDRMKSRAAQRRAGEWVRTRGICEVQGDQSIANQAGAAFRSDLNNELQALVTLSSGAAAPGTTYAHQLWADTTSGLLKKRNAANSGWVVVRTLDESFVLSRSTNTILGASDVGKTVAATSTFTQTLTAVATLGDGWWINYRNDGTGTITLDPNSTEQIDGATTVDLGPGEAVTIVCNGSAFKTLGRKNGEFRSVQVYTTSGGNTWTKPAGLKRVRVTVVGGGGSGGGCAATAGAQSASSGGGAAGGASIKIIEAASLGTTETATVGAKGAAPAAGANNGNAGGTSSFGAHCSATGGAGGPASTAGNSGATFTNSAAAGGVGSSGTINLKGGPGGAGFMNTGTAELCGHGGSSMLGGGPPATRNNTAGIAADANAYGAGGSGAAIDASQSAQAGGAGADGIIIVEEFF